jgi:hypothetical protein
LTPIIIITITIIIIVVAAAITITIIIILYDSRMGSFLAYPNLFGIKGFVVVVFSRATLTDIILTQIIQPNKPTTSLTTKKKLVQNHCEHI